MTRDRKLPSSNGLSIDPKQLRKSLSANVLSTSLNSSTHSADLDRIAASQPVGMLSSTSVYGKAGRDIQNITTMADGDSLCGHCDSPITIFEKYFILNVASVQNNITAAALESMNPWNSICTW